MSERYHCEPGSNTWHSTSRCSLYPRCDYWSHHGLPTGGELCAECRTLEKNARESSRQRSEHIFDTPVVVAAATSVDVLSAPGA
jgi:hypothetical protein